MSLLPVNKIHPDWNAFLDEAILDLLARIERDIRESGYTPSIEKVLRFLGVPLRKARVVILGQDPYPQPGVATGRAFEVGTLKSWTQPFSNISIKNILRAVYKAYAGEVITFNSLKAKFDNEFPVLGPALLFSHWEAQGVLLLNTTFTCEPGKPGSHRKIWEDFTRSLLLYISSSNSELTWFLWGNDAIAAVNHLEKIKSIAAFHPMMCFDGPGRENDFLYGNENCFRATMDQIDWTGYGYRPHPPGGTLLF